MDKVPQVHPHSRQEWRNWLQKNHLKKNKTLLIRYKKHTGKPSVSVKDAMHEAICFGWIDTTAKRLDEDRYQICYVKRSDKGRWSKNTLSYGKRLLKEGKMSEHGQKMYKLGLEKGAFDAAREKEPRMPVELKQALMENNEAWNNFNNFAPSYQKAFLRWLENAKLPETRNKRIREIVKRAMKNNKFAF